MLEDFDPRPPEYRGSSMNRLPDLLNAIRGEQLCISLLLDSNFCRTTEESIHPVAHNIPTNENLKDTITAFKKSLDVTQEVFFPNLRQVKIYHIFLYIIVRVKL